MELCSVLNDLREWDALIQESAAEEEQFALLAAEGRAQRAELQQGREELQRLRLEEQRLQGMRPDVPEASAWSGELARLAADGRALEAEERAAAGSPRWEG